MKTIKYSLVAALYLLVLSVPAKADQYENLVFTGYATCQDTTCSSSGNGPVSGIFTVDLTTEITAGYAPPSEVDAIVGPWSFSTPLGAISSTETGASGYLYDNVGQVFVEFAVNTTHFYEYIFLEYPPSNVLLTGPVEPISGICENDSTSTVTECDTEAYTLTGSDTVAAPEPSCLLLFGSGLFALPPLLRRGSPKRIRSPRSN